MITMPALAGTPSNPDKTEKIFGYNAIITTSMEPELGIELPVGCVTFAGNANRSWGAWVLGSMGARGLGSMGAGVHGRAILGCGRDTGCWVVHYVCEPADESIATDGPMSLIVISSLDPTDSTRQPQDFISPASSNASNPIFPEQTRTKGAHAKCRQSQAPWKTLCLPERNVHLA
jgi:hypothetical protein